jgi:two-component system sensor histidine kinase MprB
MRFRTRLTILVGAAVALSIATASAVLFVLVSTLLNVQVDDELAGRMSDLSQFAANAATVCPAAPSQTSGVTSPAPSAATGSSPAGPTSSAPRAAGTPCPLPANLKVPTPKLGGAGGQVQFIDEQGVVTLALDEGAQLPVSASARALAAAGSGPDLKEDAVVGGIPVRVVTRAIGNGRAVQVGLRLDGIESLLASLRWILLAVSLVGVAIAVGLGRWIAGSAMRPVSRLMVATEHVAGTHDLRERIAEPGSDELGRLAHSFNRMLEALDASEHLQRQLVADASHELRTPLSSLRTNIEVLALGRGLSDDDRERLLGSLTGQVERLSRLVADLIDLARGDEPLAPLLVETRLDELVAASVDVARGHYPGLSIKLVARPCLVTGDPERIRRAIDNLLDNAGKWSLAGGNVEVAVADGEVSVRDHGPGVEPADRGHVFDRFWRAPTARSTPGSGLGLAIVQQVARVHGGEVRLESPADGGSRFVLRLPVADQPLDLEAGADEAGEA